MNSQPISQPTTLTTWTAPREKTNAEKAIWAAPWLLAMGSLLVAGDDYEPSSTTRKGQALEAYVEGARRVLGLVEFGPDSAQAVLIGRLLMAGFVLAMAAVVTWHLRRRAHLRDTGRRFAAGGATAPVFPPAFPGASGRPTRLRIDVRIDEQGHVVFHGLETDPARLAQGAPAEYWVHAYRRELTRALNTDGAGLLCALQSRSGTIARSEQQFLAALGVPFQTFARQPHGMPASA